MSSRTHWVFVRDGSPLWDFRAVPFVVDAIRRKAATTLPPRAYGEAIATLTSLPVNFRKAMPILVRLGEAVGWTGVKKIRSFRLPKHLRQRKNPINVWRPE